MRLREKRSSRSRLGKPFSVPNVGQILFETEYSSLRESLAHTATECHSKDDEIEMLRRRAERAENLLERSYKGAGAWNTAREAVEERLAELSVDQELTSSTIAKLETERNNWMTSKLQWDEERRELCERIAELERDKEVLEGSPSESHGECLFILLLIVSRVAPVE
jgi:chromosome segregation ATPase